MPESDRRSDSLISSQKDLEALLRRGRPISDLRLGDILIAARLLAPEQLEEALALQRTSGGKHLGRVLAESGMVQQVHVTAALAYKLGIPTVALGSYEIPAKVLGLISAEVASGLRVLPLAELNGRLVVAMENPFDWQAIEKLRFHTNRAIEALLMPPADLNAAIDRLYRRQEEEELEAMVDDLDFRSESEAEGDQALRKAEVEAQTKPMVRLVNAILIQGIDLGASDIHIRPDREQVTILYRVDGRLRVSRTLSKSVLPALVSRVKITGRMNIAERRLPQDGHAKLTRNGRLIDLRISAIPTVDGESIVIRVLDKQAGVKPVDGLGLGERELRLVKKMTTMNNGIFLVTGPTGSGKSTTLYAVLNEIKRREPHIITVEDPVEYAMDGVEQIQVLNQIGYTFAEALRHILRHDPDVVMIGEIRDLETARIANRAALTGHMVLSTLHTNDAASAITRLVDMGIENYLVAATLRGALAQRLIRLNCIHCKEPEKDVEDLKSALGAGPEEQFYRGRGCPECNNTGYKGRAAVVEMIEVTNEIARLIVAGASTLQIRDAAVEQGMMPLTQNALQLAREGKTSLEEVYDIRLE